MDKKVIKLLSKHDAVVVINNHKTGEIKYIWGRNIVTTAGDVWYAQKSCGESPTNAFANLYLATAGPGTPAKADTYASYTVAGGSSKAPTGGYPRTADPDPDNTGAGTKIVSWKYEYSMGDGPFTAITHSFIARSGAGGSDPILNSFKWASSWSKDSSTSCKVFANHEMNGV